jgi:hypothetical protein
MRQRTLVNSSCCFPRRRGSILLLVLVLLALLVLMVTTLIYAARLETLAARSAVQSVQNRMEPASVVPNAVDLLRGQLGQPTAFNQVWALAPRPPAISGSTGIAPASGARETSGTLAIAWSQISPTGTRWPGWLEIEDQSALLNVNTVAPYPRDPGHAEPLEPGILPAQVLERLIAQRLAAAGYNSSGAAGITRLILSLRWGSGPSESLESGVRSLETKNRRAGELANKQTGELANRQTGERANWRTGPFVSLDAVRLLTGLPKPAFDAIAPFITTFSCSCELWQDEDGAAYELAALNTLDPEGIFQILRHVYPDAPEDLLRQFALNIVDRRDPDSLPSVWPSATGGNALLGFEPTPVISEVCPDVITFTEDGDNGEYIEICNPLPEPVDLRGWSIDWGSASHILNTTLAPGACLVLTDDIQNENDPTPEDKSPGMGSFVAIFGLPILARNQIAEEPAMDIPDEQGLIRLFDAEGNLIDYLTYRGGTFNGLHRGFHKRNVFSHTGEPGPATPFVVRLEGFSDAYEEECWQILVAAMNKPYTSAVELLAAPVFLETPEKVVRLEDGVFPLFGISSGSQPDLRLVDVFTAAEGRDAGSGGDLPRPWSSLGKPGEKSEDRAVSPRFLHPQSAIRNPQSAIRPPGTVAFGKINLNTAPSEVLQVLPGLDPETVGLIAAYRARAQSPALVPSASGAGIPTWRRGMIPFRSLSDFANNPAVWSKRNDVQRLHALFALAPHATFNSTSFRAKSSGAGSSESGGISPTGLGSQAFINLSEAGVDVLDWRFRFPGQDESVTGTNTDQVLGGKDSEDRNSIDNRKKTH